MSKPTPALHSCAVLRFPPRAIHSILIIPERDSGAWLVLARANGWICGSVREARREAEWLSANLGLPECAP
jgi:hypothetical protein